MNQSSPIPRFFRAAAAVLILPLSAATAQPAGTPPATAVAPTRPSLAEPPPVAILKGRPDADPSSETLGERYVNKGAGLSFRPPVQCKQVATPSADEVVEFSSDKSNWLLRVSKPTFPTPVPLTTTRDRNNKETTGLLEYTAQQIKTATPGAVILRQDVINVDASPAGMIALRFTLGTQRWLRQQAIVQGSDQLYYIFNLTTPAGNINPGDDESKLPPDPLEKAAVEAFGDMIDSIKLMDRAPIKDDQNQRLFRTRAMFLYWTPRKFDAIKVDKQYWRYLRGGKDVGYSYVEEMDNDPKLTGVNGEGAVVYERSHRVETDDKGREQFVDVGSFKFMSFDRKREGWTRIVVLQANNNGSVEETHTTEYAEGRWEANLKYSAEGGVIPREERAGDTKAPPMRAFDTHTLEVTNTGKGGDAPPTRVDLPPFYLPAAGEHFLPRLVVEKAYREPRTYLYAVYAPETKDVRLLYVDVSHEHDVAFAGKRYRAIEVTERLGLEGSPTVYYVTADGKCLGSENKATHAVVLPSDEESILKIWPDAKLTRPDKMRKAQAN